MAFYIFLAFVNIVSVDPVNSTAVNVSWTQVNLPVIGHYTVHYIHVGGQQGGFALFPSTASFGVVEGLLAEQQYQLGVSVTVGAAKEKALTGSVNYTQPVAAMMTSK